MGKSLHSALDVIFISISFPLFTNPVSHPPVGDFFYMLMITLSRLEIVHQQFTLQLLGLVTLEAMILILVAPLKGA